MSTTKDAVGGAVGAVAPYAVLGGIAILAFMYRDQIASWIRGAITGGITDPIVNTGTTIWNTWYSGMDAAATAIDDAHHVIDNTIADATRPILCLLNDTQPMCHLNSNLVTPGVNTVTVTPVVDISISTGSGNTSIVGAAPWETDHTQDQYELSGGVIDTGPSLRTKQLAAIDTWYNLAYAGQGQYVPPEYAGKNVSEGWLQKNAIEAPGGSGWNTLGYGTTLTPAQYTSFLETGSY